ncbi:MAG: SDR family oxidoreductase [Gemmatimonadota bacterium]|jgi:uncharacterized protein YbjT (DUF2867 family)|nr:SDR family oxidoreductase [Gemmatimonadota bacterium]
MSSAPVTDPDSLLSESPPTSELILLTGASGYIGGRLLRLLEAQGRKVRCLARHAEYLVDRVGPETQVMAGNVLVRGSLDSPLRGVDTAYYLVHSMTAANGFEEADRQAARNFGEAARAAGVRRIIYLGGLVPEDGGLSPHLRSRQETGDLLRASGVEVIEFRASIVLGAGSLSFEMIRALVERLPVMITPKWVQVAAQPIGIEDVLAYLVAALDLPPGESRVLEIGGRDVVTYGQLMKEYARQRNLKRLMIPVPVLTPRLSSLWLGLVTPLYARVGRTLVESMRHATVVKDPSALELFPSIRPLGSSEAIARALRNEDREMAETRWSDALAVVGQRHSYGGERVGNRLLDSRSIHVEAPPSAAFAAVRRIGGETGWYFANLLWRIRGWMDILSGGVGMRRGRRHPDQLRVGDVVDWWRVEALTPDRYLRLAAEMKLPGRGWIEYEVAPEGSGSRITQTATLDPHGLAGLIYWYGVWPIHAVVFRGMIRGIARAAIKVSADSRR